MFPLTLLSLNLVRSDLRILKVLEYHRNSSCLLLHLFQQFNIFFMISIPYWPYKVRPYKWKLKCSWQFNNPADIIRFRYCQLDLFALFQIWLYKNSLIIFAMSGLSSHSSRWTALYIIGKKVIVSQVNMVNIHSPQFLNYLTIRQTFLTRASIFTFSLLIKRSPHDITVFKCLNVFLIYNFFLI